MKSQTSLALGATVPGPQKRYQGLDTISACLMYRDCTQIEVVYILNVMHRMKPILLSTDRC